ncbi:hypothetical protein HPP92_023865 [Vanilla planifolia]|uniref:O-methyltransferase C-terminal domain-containing protein n=1 Tax=Vanilla planifolia TaxID=51239 RepID=A0A835PKY0_VANPL|nr:hypothetical protein HPP92_023865 [Vanilla planifolia]
MEPHLQLHQIDVPAIRRRARHPRRYPPPRYSRHRLRPLRLHHRATSKFRHLRSLMCLLNEGHSASHVTPFGEEAFDLTPISRFLLSTSIHCSSPFVRMILDRHIVDSSQVLADWDLTVVRPQFNSIFNIAIERDSSFVMDIATRVGGEAFRWIGSLVDVEGDNFFTTAKLVEVVPSLRWTVFDLPHVIATAQRAS